MKPTVTIGIPAYNEEANIRYLVEELLSQSKNGYNLQSIIVSSDGSNDKTVSILNSIDSPLLTIIDDKRRLGVAARQNEIFIKSKADILILLNADISIPDKHFIEEIIKPVIEENAGLVTPQYKQMVPKTYFERILYCSTRLKFSIYDAYKNGNNIYTCCGPARAFSKKLYTKLRFKTSTNEDAFSYLFAVNNGFKYCHTHATAIYFRLPNNFADHKKQSTRFINSKKNLQNEFSAEYLKKAYYLPFSLVIRNLAKFIFRYPVELVAYVMILMFISLISPMETQSNGAWESSKSSKIVHS